MPPRSSIIVPLYIYPLPAEWDPLHEAISSNPDLSFVVILNPQDGPGPRHMPDADYAREIPKLNAYPNVCTVGYVRINYCKRAIGDVCRDVYKYASWSGDHARSGLRVQGIFFDETPNLYSEHVASYLNTIDRIVEEAQGVLGGLVIHNPGTIPDHELATPGPGVSAVFEASYDEYCSKEIQERLSSLIPYPRNKCAYFVHSVPANEMVNLVMDLRCRGQYLFVTDLSELFYVRFGPSWMAFIDAMRLD